MKDNNKNKPILTIIILLIIFTTYSVITAPIPECNNTSTESLSPTLDHPDPSFPTLVETSFGCIPESGEFWEMIHMDDYSDNQTDRQNFGTTAQYGPVYFRGAYNKFGPHIRYGKKEDIDAKYKGKQWYYICYLTTACMDVVFRDYS